MSNINLFTHPETFRRIQLKGLCAWLGQWRDYLARRGFTVPDPAADSAVDYEGLAAVFMEPDGEMPRQLMHSAAMIHEMANEGAMGALLERARQENIKLDVGDDPDPADVAVQMCLGHADVLEEVHNLHQLDRPRSFVHFTTDRRRVPTFREPTDGALAGLEAEIAEWNFKAKRGRSARVWMYRRAHERWFLVRHGLASRRQEVITASGSESVIQRPGEYDVLVYDCERGELRIHGCNVKEVEMLRQVFGGHLFGDKEFFPGGEKFTLAPLLTGRACLACGDFPTLANVTLREVTVLRLTGSDWLRLTVNAPDLFGPVGRGDVTLPGVEGLVRATFELRFKDSKKRRTLTVAGSNRLKVVRDDDTTLLERWLAARGFVLEPEVDDEETANVVECAGEAGGWRGGGGVEA